MKIAFIVGQFPALSATFILNQVTGLLDLGHDVRIFAFKDPGEERIHPDVDRYELWERTCYFDIPLSRGPRLKKALALMARNFFKAPGSFIKALNVIKYGKEALAMNLVHYITPFLGKDFQVIYCHFGPNGVIGSYINDLLPGSTLVTVFHGYDLSQYLVGKRENPYERLFHRGRLFLPISGHWHKKLLELGCQAEKIKVHHMGIDVNRFQPVEKEAAPLCRLLTIGRLVEKKGTRYALEALARLADRDIPFEFKVVGDGPLRQELEDLSQSLGLKEQVSFLGPRRGDEIAALFGETDIFLLPSVTAQNGDQEGIPVVLMEAQAMGIPVVSTLHTGIPELVVHEGSGYLVPERDSEALAHRLEYLATHPALWPAMGKKGREIVENHFNIDTLNRQLAEMLEISIEQEN